MPVRFVITTLKPGVEPAEYERWVRERDYALVRDLPNFISYTVHRIRHPIQVSPDPGWQYIERIEVRSLEQHDRDLASPEGMALLAELYGRFLDRAKNVRLVTDVIE